MGNRCILNTNSKPSGVAILLSVKGDFRAKNVTGVKVIFVTIKGSIHPE